MNALAVITFFAVGPVVEIIIPAPADMFKLGNSLERNLLFCKAFDYKQKIRRADVGIPYKGAEFFPRFTDVLVRVNSVLFAGGLGDLFVDNHVCRCHLGGDAKGMNFGNL